MTVSYAGIDRRSPPGRGQALVSIGDRSLAGEVGAEVASSLSAALEQLDLILQSGRVGRADLNAVRGEVERARQVAMLGQQVSRLAAGMAQQTPEALELPDLLHLALQQGRDELAARGLRVHARLRPAALSADASLLFTLLHCLLRWACGHCHGPAVQLSTELEPWPVRALLRCDFARGAPDHPADGPQSAAATGLDTLAWRLVEQAAAALGVQLQREVSAAAVRVTLAFPEAARQWAQLDDPAPGRDAPPAQRPPLAGGRVLLLTARSELCRVAQAVLPPLGLELTVSASAAEARGWDHRRASVLVADAALPGLEVLCQALDAGAGGPALVLVGDAAAGVHVELDGRSEVLRLGQGTALRDLPRAVRYALVR